MTTEETLRQIKQSFRLIMDGVTSQSMREKGAGYHLNWGANILHLREMAKEYTPDYHLAMALWKENIRECKIMATILMPHDLFTSDIALLWIEQTPTPEIAEMASMNLYRHLPYAKDLALQLIAQNDECVQFYGYCILSWLFTDTEKASESFTESELNEFIDQAKTAFDTQNITLKHKIQNAVIKFSNISDLHYSMAKSAGW